MIILNTLVGKNFLARCCPRLMARGVFGLEVQGLVWAVGRTAADHWLRRGGRGTPASELWHKMLYPVDGRHIEVSMVASTSHSSCHEGTHLQLVIDLPWFCWNPRRRSLNTGWSNTSTQRHLLWYHRNKHFLFRYFITNNSRGRRVGPI